MLGHAKKYLKRPYTSEYIDAENEVRVKRLGLWKQESTTFVGVQRHGKR
ncbi:MAG: hypothetical protein AB1480_11045 [Nitrospirota bacterium]